MSSESMNKLNISDNESFDNKMSVMHEIQSVVSSKNCKLEDVPKILKQTDEMVGYLKEKGLMAPDGTIKV